MKGNDDIDECEQVATTYLDKYVQRIETEAEKALAERVKVVSIPYHEDNPNLD